MPRNPKQCQEQQQGQKCQVLLIRGQCGQTPRKHFLRRKGTIQTTLNYESEGGWKRFTGADGKFTTEWIKWQKVNTILRFMTFNSKIEVLLK